MSISSLSEVNNLTIKAMYRMFLKNMKYYPSKNRFEVLLAIKEEFHDHKAITDERQIRIEKKKARIGLAHILMYKDKNKEFVETYRIKDDHSELYFNAKDKDFIYF